MTYRIELAPAARRALTHGLPEAVATACANFLHDVLSDDPSRVGKPLRGNLAGRFVARRGDFRVVYEIHEDVVVVRVISIRHRRDAYS